MHESVIFTDDNDEKMCMMRGKIRRNRIRFSQYLNKITFLKIKVFVASSPLFFTESIFRGGQDSISNKTHRLVELKKICTATGKGPFALRICGFAQQPLTFYYVLAIL